MLIPLANVWVPVGHRGSAVRQAERHLRLRTYLLAGEIGSKWEGILTDGLKHSGTRGQGLGQGWPTRSLFHTHAPGHLLCELLGWVPGP